MAIAVAGTSASGNGTTGQSTVTFSWNNSGSAQFLLVAVGGWHTASRSVSGVKYNDVSLSSVATHSYDADGNFASIWRLDSPATGSNNVVVTLSGTCSEFGAIATGFTGGDTSDLIVGTNNSNGNSANPSLSLSVIAGGMTFGVLYSNANPAPAGTQQGEINPLSGAAGSWLNAQTEAQASTTTDSMSWTMGSNYWAAAAVSLRPSSGSASAVPVHLIQRNSMAQMIGR